MVTVETVWNCGFYKYGLPVDHHHLFYLHIVNQHKTVALVAWHLENTCI